MKLKGYERDLKAFCKATRRRKDTFRAQVQGFGRSEAQKAVWAERSEKVGTVRKKSENSALQMLTNGDESGIIASRTSVNVQFFGKPNFSSQRTAGLKKTIRSLESRIEEHKRKIAEPEKIYPE